MKSSIEEHKILNQVIDEFIECKNTFTEWDDSFGFKFLSELGEVRNPGFLNGISDFILFFIEKIVNLPFIHKLSNLIHNIITKIMNESFNLGNVTDLLDYFAQSFLNFSDFLHKYNIDNIDLKIEYFIVTFLSILSIPIGRINDYNYYENITQFYVLVENMPEMFTIEEGKFCEDKEGDPVADIIKKINNNLVHKKLFKFSKFLNYKTFEEDRKILKYSCLKIRKLMDIYQFGMDFDRSNINLYDYYARCLFIKLLDDIRNIGKYENNIFKTNDKKNNTAYVIALMQLACKYNPQIKSFYASIIIIFVHYNRQYFLDELNTYIIQNIKIINFEAFNYQKLLHLFEKKNFLEKFMKIFLGNNLSQKK